MEIQGANKCGTSVLIEFIYSNEYLLTLYRGQLRCMWYLCMVLVEESGPTICDTVEISYNLGQFCAGAFDRTALKGSFDLVLKAIPSRLVGYHYCFDDVRFRTVWGVITVFLGKKARMRARDHEGTHVECRYGLMSYGIPVDALSVMVDGYEDNSKFLKWLEERQTKETNGVANPEREDD